MSIITDKQLSQKTDKAIWLAEKASKGSGRFCAYLRPNNDPHFYFRYTDSQRKRKYIPLGVYDPKGNSGLTLKQARAKSNELSSLYQQGNTDLIEYLAHSDLVRKSELSAQVARIEATPTFHDVYAIWFDIEASTNKDGGAEVARLFKKDVLPFIAELDIDKVQAAHIHKIIDTVLRRGASRQARLVLGRVRQVFNFAFERELIDINPTARIKKSKVGTKPSERDRVLTLAELGELSRKLPLSGLVKTTQLAALLCLHTCCRIGELAKAKWEDLDLNNRLWTIPEKNSKNGRVHKIYLSDQVVELFNYLRQFSTSDTWLFPSRGDMKHIDPKTFSKQIHDRQLPHYDNIQANRSKHFNSLILTNGEWKLHDLRRTGATLMVSQGILPDVVERCLNHIEPNVIKRTYQHYTYEIEMKQAWQSLSLLLDEHIGFKV